MKKNLIAFLFGESQVDDEIAGIVESIADLDAEGSGDLKVEKKPLASALSDLGIDAKGLENDPRGLSLVFTVPEDYRAAHAILNEPDSLHKLAELGWVFSTQGDVSMANEPAELRIRFLEIDEIEPADTKASYSDSDKTRLNKVKEIIKKGREFATEEPDFDDDCNPVDHDDPKKGKRDKGVGTSKDGSDPEGTPKGAEGGIKTGSAGSAPKKGDLTQPKEGDKAKLVKEAVWVDHGDGTGTYDGPGYDRPTRMRSGGNLDLTRPTSTGPSVADQIRNSMTSGSHRPEEIAGNADYLQQSGVLHAPGCECEECKADPIGMSSAATRQSRGRPGSLPGGPAAGYYGEAGHKSGCQCGFCKNKGNIALLRKGGKKPEKKEGEPEVEETRTAHEIVNAMLEANPGTPPGIMGTKSFKTMKVPGGSKDRKFKPAKGMVQAAPENSVVAAQTKPNRSA